MLCSECKERIRLAGEKIEDSLMEEIELEGGSDHPIEDIEELRLLMKSFMRPDVLQALLEVFKLLDEEPQPTRAYSWFVRESTLGRECIFALKALESFKETRLEKLILALGESLRLLKSFPEVD